MPHRSRSAPCACRLFRAVFRRAARRRLVGCGAVPCAQGRTVRLGCGAWPWCGVRPYGWLVLIWINGPFGGGKTTLARELLSRWPRARLFDPELVGFMAREVVPPAVSGDFQDLPVWRDLVVQTARVLVGRYRCPWVVPMTVVEAE